MLSIVESKEKEEAVSALMHIKNRLLTLFSRDFDSTLRLWIEKEDKSVTPRINGYPYVDKESIRYHPTLEWSVVADDLRTSIGGEQIRGSILPKTIAKCIKKLSYNFMFFYDVAASKKMHLVSWGNLCKPKALGGLGLAFIPTLQFGYNYSVISRMYNRNSPLSKWRLFTTPHGALPLPMLLSSGNPYVIFLLW
ncbi:hypothetical protein M5K25_022505 [Dendrobium thyrsiflorum]|uniref:Uncharacterized protein n=1 Tax=Dendrobium thyrsiflorum TaxID=117978 RepID=A0ABD0U6E8_DENTH